MHFFKKIKILREKKFKNPTYLSSPNCLLSSIPYQYNPFSQPKSSYGAKKSKNVKKRHFTPIFAPKVPHIMFFRKNVTRVFVLSQKVSGGLAKFQRDLTYSFRELDFFCKKRIKGKCSFEPTGPPSPVSTERRSRMRRPPRRCLPQWMRYRKTSVRDLDPKRRWYSRHPPDTQACPCSAVCLCYIDSDSWRERLADPDGSSQPRAGT